MKKHRKTSKKSIIKKSNKKAQFFIMAGIIIILVLYTLTINYNWIRETLDLTGDYGELRDKQTGELPNVITRSMFIITDQSKCKEPNPDPNCPIPAAEDFAKRYQDYASQTDPSYGSVLILRDPYTGDIIVKNLLAKTPDGKDRYIKIDASKYGGEGIKFLWSESATTTGTVTINIGGHESSMSFNTPVSSFGEQFTKASLGNVPSLDIILDDGSSASINLEEAGTYQATITNSQDKNDNIIYDVCPPPRGPDGNYIDSNCF